MRARRRRIRNMWRLRGKKLNKGIYSVRRLRAERKLTFSENAVGQDASFLPIILLPTDARVDSAECLDVVGAQLPPFRFQCVPDGANQTICLRLQRKARKGNIDHRTDA